LHLRRHGKGKPPGTGGFPLPCPLRALEKI
jgi:hypothetical protein